MKHELVDDVHADCKVSIRRAYAVLQLRLSTYHYHHPCPSQAQRKTRIKEIAETRVRYGYRRIHVLLRREGWRVNTKRVYRLYYELGLHLRNKTPKRKVKAKLREDRAVATRSNETWAMRCPGRQAERRREGILSIINWRQDPRYAF